MTRMTTEELCAVIRTLLPDSLNNDPVGRALVEMLRRGGHTSECQRWRPDSECTCGWTEIERAAREAGVL